MDGYILDAINTRTKNKNWPQHQVYVIASFGDGSDGSSIFAKTQCLQKIKISNQCVNKSESKVTFCPATTHILNVVHNCMKKGILLILGIGLAIGILFFNFYCSVKSPTTQLENNFTRCQIKDLETITDFFKSQICKNKESDFKICFTEFFSQLSKNEQNPIWDNIDFSQQQKLYNSISQSTFDEIWMFGKSTRATDKMDFKSIGSRFNGKYQKFVEQVGKDNEGVKKYAEHLTGYGNFEGISMLLSRIYENQKDFNFYDPNIQLILSVHCLSLNDIHKRQEKWDQK